MSTMWRVHACTLCWCCWMQPWRIWSLLPASPCRPTWLAPCCRPSLWPCSVSCWMGGPTGGLCCVLRWFTAVLCYANLPAGLCWAVLCCAVQWLPPAALCCVVLCCAVQCFTCYAVLCHVMASTSCAVLCCDTSKSAWEKSSANYGALLGNIDRLTGVLHAVACTVQLDSAPSYFYLHVCMTLFCCISERMCSAISAMLQQTLLLCLPCLLGSFLSCNVPYSGLLCVTLLFSCACVFPNFWICRPMTWQ